jgi:hypothetical protein
MKSPSLPPDRILTAYARLIDRAFAYIRSKSFINDDKVRDQIGDLADALHNVSGILTDYGGWTDDERFRELYLRPFDRKWGKEVFRMERFLEQELGS